MIITIKLLAHFLALLLLDFLARFFPFFALFLLATLLEVDAFCGVEAC
jgi:hypothetical protein